MMDLYRIALSSWIIQDGNYGDFARDETRAFALEFSPVDVLEVIAAPARNIKPALAWIADDHYQITARVAHAGAHWWVADFGLPAYIGYELPAAYQIGSWLTGEVQLGIDAFPYFETFALQNGAPPLIHDWRIRKIDIQTGPYIERGPNWQERDPNRLGWQEVAETNAWEDDGGNAEYLLHVSPVGGAPRLTLRE